LYYWSMGLAIIIFHPCGSKSSWEVLVVNNNYESLPGPIFHPLG